MILHAIRGDVLTGAKAIRIAWGGEERCRQQYRLETKYRYTTGESASARAVSVFSFLPFVQRARGLDVTAIDVW